MKISITVIPHENQRYDTIGDWQFDEVGDLQIRVSDTGDWKMNFLIARHELDEAILCKQRGITQEQVDEYDQTHIAGGDCFSNCSDAPYYTSHNDALASEWQMARLLGIDWIEYGDVVESLKWDSKNAKGGTNVHVQQSKM